MTRHAYVGVDVQVTALTERDPNSAECVVKAHCYFELP